VILRGLSPFVGDCPKGKALVHVDHPSDEALFDVLSETDDLGMASRRTACLRTAPAARAGVCPAHMALDEVPVASAPSPRELDQSRAMAGAQPRRTVASAGRPAGRRAERGAALMLLMRRRHPVLGPAGVDRFPPVLESRRLALAVRPETRGSCRA
jgi:hypothetical protein